MLRPDQAGDGGRFRRSGGVFVVVVDGDGDGDGDRPEVPEAGLPSRRLRLRRRLPPARGSLEEMVRDDGGGRCGSPPPGDGEDAVIDASAEVRGGGGEARALAALGWG